MTEIRFNVMECPEGGLTSSAVDYSIVTEADTLVELQKNVREADECHFEDGTAPKMIRLQIVHDEVPKV